MQCPAKGVFRYRPRLRPRLRKLRHERFPRLLAPRFLRRFVERRFPQQRLTARIRAILKNPGLAVVHAILLHVAQLLPRRPGKAVLRRPTRRQRDAFEIIARDRILRRAVRQRDQKVRDVIRCDLVRGRDMNHHHIRLHECPVVRVNKNTRIRRRRLGKIRVQRPIDHEVIGHHHDEHQGAQDDAQPLHRVEIVVVLLHRVIAPDRWRLVRKCRGHRRLRS